MTKLEQDLHDANELFAMARAESDDASLKIIDTDTLANDV